LPKSLAEVYGYHRAALTTALFRAAARSVLSCLKSKKYLGALPGIIAVLNTWGELLAVHPHVHLIVTAGGLSHGTWRTAKDSRLVPRPLLDAAFSRLLSAELRKASDVELAALADKLEAAQQKLHVWIGPRIEDARPILHYLADGFFSGPIANDRLISFDGKKITFSYHDWKDCASDGTPRLKDTTIEVLSFLKLWAIHLPDKAQQCIRQYGLYAHCASKKLARARVILQQDGDAAAPKPARALGAPMPATRLVAPRCPCCLQPIRQTPYAPRPPPGLPFIALHSRPVSLREALGKRRFIAA